MSKSQADFCFVFAEDKNKENPTTFVIGFSFGTDTQNGTGLKHLILPSWCPDFFFCYNYSIKGTFLQEIIAKSLFFMQQQAYFHMPHSAEH